MIDQPNKNNLSWGTYAENQLRVLVNHWDEEFIYVREKGEGRNEKVEGRELQVCYSNRNPYLTRGGIGDWSYLSKILSEGSALNLVRLRYDGQVCMPELIIFEPDYLVSITSIARCFEEHIRHTPFLCLLDKVSPSETTRFILLGNLSGTLLDDTVHEHSTPFSDSYDSFFHDHIVDIMCDSNTADIETFLCQNGEMQQQNIEKLIGEDITHIPNYDRSKVVLEPSFFSEVLGVQGRLDFLFQDGEDVVIVEQKSGKGRYVRRTHPQYNADPEVPVPVEKHIVQLLLYRALFVYEFEKYADQLKRVFLLYSRYSKGLISIVQRPDLMLEAIRMRNLIAWTEMQYTRPEGFRYLEKITPHYLRDPKVVPAHGDFFQKYKEPGINDLLQPLHTASPLARSYYYRFQRFLAQEQWLSRVGDGTRDVPGFASVWLDSLDTKKAAGSIYDGLSIESFGEKSGAESIDEQRGEKSLHDLSRAVQSVTLSFATQHVNDTTNFRKGDLVFLYHYRSDKVPDACAQMVHRGSILDLTERGLTIRLTNAQTDRKVFEVGKGMLWAVEPDMIEAGSSALYRNMHSFLSANSERRDLLLFQREPRTDNTRTLCGDYGSHNELVLRAKRAEDYFLVIGPPGTGKTSHAMLNILREELHNPEGRILLLSFTNRAVDEMCQTLQETGIPFMRVGNDLSCGERFIDSLLVNQLKDCRTKSEAISRFTSARVVCGTTSSLNSHLALLRLRDFSLAIVDESSQILEPHLVGLLSAKYQGGNAIRKIVLIGDHKQLPAVVQQEASESAVTEPELLNIGLQNCRLSLFERLLNHFRTALGNYNPDVVFMLTRQGRMHPDIAEFPNHAFYADKLEALGVDIVPHQGLELPVETDTGNGITDMLKTRYIAFVATPEVKDSPSDKVNLPEAEMIAATVIRIYIIEQASFDKDKTLGVIVPYRNQISTIHNTIARMAREQGLTDEALLQLHGISIDTVERYQGSQRRYIIYGFTIQRAYQLDFLTSTNFVENGEVIDRKLNVVMTRAREHLIIFGNPALLRLNPVYSGMMNFIRTTGSYYAITPEEYCRGAFKAGYRNRL